MNIWEQFILQNCWTGFNYTYISNKQKHNNVTVTEMKMMKRISFFLTRY